MKLFLSFERKLEKLLDDFFQDRYRGEIRLPEVARKLLGEMQEKKLAGVKNIYVPDEYTVFCSPGDYQALLPFLPLLTGEFCGYLEERSREKGFTVVGPLKVSFVPDETLSAGAVRVQGVFSGKQKEEQADYASFENTLHYVRGGMRIPAGKRASLIITAGLEKGREIFLERFPVVIGRRSDCDVTVADPAVSRRHARLECNNGEFFLCDLGSTNGTFINNMRVDTCKLKPGDQIKIGSTFLFFRVG